MLLFKESVTQFRLILKVAAKRSRKRKYDQIKQLGDDVHKIQTRKIDLFHEYIQLIVEVCHWNKKVSGLREDILKVFILIRELLIIT